jgi:hypothetical protein
VNGKLLKIERTRICDISGHFIGILPRMLEEN